MNHSVWSWSNRRSALALAAGVMLGLFVFVSRLQSEPLPNPIIKQLAGLDFVELRPINHQFLIRRVPETELKLPGNETAVIRVTAEFVRLRQVYRQELSKVNYNYSRCDYWIPISSIIAVVDEFPPKKETNESFFRRRHR